MKKQYETITNKNYAGMKWGKLPENEKTELLSGANAVDGRTGNNMMGDGECTIDLSVYPFSVHGKVVGGEVMINDDAAIYSSEG